MGMGADKPYSRRMRRNSMGNISSAKRPLHTLLTAITIPALVLPNPVNC